MHATKEHPGHGSVAARPGQDLFLLPGQWYLGHQAGRVRTLLGSCVAITLWHPERRIGGMCHYLLPSRRVPAEAALDGRYGDEAMALMLRALRQLHTHPEEYVAHLYGGADTLSGHGGSRFNIGERNIEQGWTLIDRHGFHLDGVDVGDLIPRTVALTLASGDVQLRRGHGKPAGHDDTERPAPCPASRR